MPSKSKAQFRFMKGVESGNIKAPGLSKKEAADFTKGVSYSKLPDTKKNKRFSKLFKK